MLLKQLWLVVTFSQPRPKGGALAQGEGRCSLLNVAAGTVVPTRVQNCDTCEQIDQSHVVSIVCRAISYMGKGPHFRTVMV